MDITLFCVCLIAALASGTAGFYAMSRLARRADASTSNEDLELKRRSEEDAPLPLLESIPVLRGQETAPVVAAPAKRVIKLTSPKPPPAVPSRAVPKQVFLMASPTPPKQVLLMANRPAPSPPPPPASASLTPPQSSRADIGGAEVAAALLLGLGVLGILVIGAAAVAASSSPPKPPPFPREDDRW